MSSFVKRSLIFSFPVILSQLKLVDAFAQCYYPDGSIPQDYVWEPCSGALYSSCCVPSEGDVCQENGLCYYPDVSNDGGFGTLYRGTCTDRTWTDAACKTNVCVSGYETTWMYLVECQKNPSEVATVVCGKISEGIHETATCPGTQITMSTGILTTTTTTSAKKNTALPSINTAIYSLYTSIYTVTITATEQSTTETSTFMSTFTSTLASTFTSPINEAVATGTSTSAQSSPTFVPVASKPKQTVTIGTGTLIAIIVAPVFAMALLLPIIFYIRKKRGPRQDEPIRLNSAVSQSPPNGLVGADQVYPYEMELNEVANPRKEAYRYKQPKFDTYEIDDRSATLGSEKRGWEKAPGTMEAGGEGWRSPISPVTPLRSPAPTYAQAMMPVELE